MISIVNLTIGVHWAYCKWTSGVLTWCDICTLANDTAQFAFAVGSASFFLWLHIFRLGVISCNSTFSTWLLSDCLPTSSSAARPLDMPIEAPLLSEGFEFGPEKWANRWANKWALVYSQAAPWAGVINIQQKVQQTAYHRENLCSWWIYTHAINFTFW